LKAGAVSMRAVGGLKVASRAAGRTFLAEVADFSLATENIDEWDDCLEFIGAVCKTIEFTDSAAA
jgi:hypothetical protein